jgi:hypothetical protein
MKKATKHILTLIIFITICFAIVFGLYYIGVLAIKLGFPNEPEILGVKLETLFIGLQVIALIAGISFLGYMLFLELRYFYLWIVENIENKYNNSKQNECKDSRQKKRS